MATEHYTRFSELVTRPMFAAKVLADEQRIDLLQYFLNTHTRWKEGEQFPYDLEELVPTVFSNKGKAVRALTEKYTQDVDFRVISQNGNDETAFGGVRSVDKYYLTCTCFEHMVAKRNKAIFAVYSQVFHTEVENQIQTQSAKHYVETNKIFRSVLSVLKVAGVEPNLAIVRSLEEARRVTGVDLKPLIGTSLLLEAEKTPLNLGGLGALYGGVSNQKMGTLLTQHGFRVKPEGAKDYIPTEKGFKYCTSRPISEENGHNGYQYLWFPEVLNELPPLTA